MTDVMAVPFSPLPVEKFEKLVDGLVCHRPWFDDLLYENEQIRRQTVIAYLADAHNNGKLFEVWKGEELIGILLINELIPFRDARCHFVFLDAKLADKRQLCLNVMGWAFTQIPVEVLRVEIPTYASALLKFVRKSLGFRFEGERRPFSWPAMAPQLDEATARLGSRKHRAVMFKGAWHDAMLLSVTADEFVAYLASEEARNDGRTQNQPLESGVTAGAHSAGAGAS